MIEGEEIPKGLQEQSLADLVSGFIKLNELNKIHVKEVNAKEVIIGAVKKIPVMPEEEVKAMRKEMIAAVKEIYQPYVDGKKIQVHITFIRPDYKK